MKCKGFGHLAINVSNLEQAMDFYCGLLGMKPLFEIRIPSDIAERQPDSPFASLAGKVSIQYLQFPDGTLLELFHPRPETDLNSGGPNYDKLGFVHLSIVVDDLQAWAAYLQEHGVPLDSAIRMGPDRTYTLWIKDPDGNRIELMEYTDESLQVVSGEK
ncbi:MAG: VOC family protein [Oscillospiraceae bacterium]|nr:VOC family protein [Oscillospiraceae bacterium]